MNKKCFKCKQTKHINLFYRHNGTADGYLNKCKLCTKKDVKRRYDDPVSILKIVEYEKKRNQTPERKLAKLIYQQTRRLKYPNKNKARYKLFKAVKDGRILKRPCEVCGNIKVEAHHTDYRKFLDVKWLCKKHHLEIENKKHYNTQ